MIEQLILHLTGDYIFQNQWMSDKKTENSYTGYFAAILHAAVYSVPFWIFLTNWKGWLFIFVSHIIIDKYQAGVLWRKLINFNTLSEKDYKNWVKIIIDNTFHLICNYFAIVYLDNLI